MGHLFKNLIGIVWVEQKGDSIRLGGLAVESLARDIKSTWSTSKINDNMFTDLGRRSIEFPLFYALEVHYMLRSLLKNRRNYTSRRTIETAIRELEQNTWLANTVEGKEFPKVLDRSKLNLFYKTPLPHQLAFFDVYEKGKAQLGLNGYLLSAAAGSGKTLIDLMIAEMVGSDYVVIVSPNNAIHRVWKAALIGEKREYKKEQPYWMVSEGKPYKNERFLITHYEGLEKLMAVVNRLHGKVTVVLDESHNFNEIKSNRTQLFLTLCERTKSENVIWASGTPIKALGGECVPLLKSIDPLFTPKVEASFRQIFGVNAQRALDILRNRMSTITFLVEKSAVQKTKPITHEIRVKIPDGENYTLDAISRQMSEYVAQQLDHYKTNYQSYQDVYDHCLQVFADNITDAKVKEDFATYKRYVIIVKRNPDPRFTANEMKFCNDFESQQIAPALNQDDRKAFKGAKSVIKYVDLVVRGQALGNVLGKARSRLHVEMLKYIDFDAILSQAEKKTVVFTSYVDVVKAAESLFKSKGMRPLTAWAETNKNLASNVAAFEKDPKVNPMVATFNSLSTAVPLIMADLSIFLNVPWRDGELVQAKARTDRLGQDTQVKYFMIYLDTGKEPNISTRSKEILEWSRAQVAAIMGQDYNGEAAKTMDSYIASLEGYHDLDYNPQEVIVSFESALNSVLDHDLDTTGF